MLSLQRCKVHPASALVANGVVDPPVPFPNTVVKHPSTYNTAGSTSVGRSAAASAVSFFCSSSCSSHIVPRHVRISRFSHHHTAIMSTRLAESLYTC